MLAPVTQMKRWLHLLFWRYSAGEAPRVDPIYWEVGKPPKEDPIDRERLICLIAKFTRRGDGLRIYPIRQGPRLL